MKTFMDWLVNEAIGIATSCDQFGTHSMDRPFFMGAGSDLGCHKKKKHKLLKYKFKEELMGTTGTEFLTKPSAPRKYVGCGGGPGPCPAPPSPINNKLDNAGALGSYGKPVTIDITLKTNGCGGGPGPCPKPSTGCSGGPCPQTPTSSGSATPAQQPTTGKLGGKG